MARVAATTALCVLLAAVATAMPTGEMDHIRAKAFEAALERHRLMGEPATVAALNVTQYYGRWYECLQDWTTANTFQKASFCATADYGPDAAVPGRVTVSNREHHGNITGPEVNVSGYAYQPDAAKYPGRLVVLLHGDHASPFPAPYWVLRLGPIVNGLYDFAIVSDQFRATLFVLARDVQRFESQYKADVLSWLSKNGFTDFWNKPVALPQEGCTYFPPQL